MQPQLTVVIPTRNRCDSLLTTLTSLRFQRMDPDRFEIVVVIDGGTDGTRAAVEALATQDEWAGYTLRSVEQEWQGAAAARNTGLHEAQGDYVLFIDDDTEPHPDLIAAHLRRQTAGPAEGRVVLGQITQEPNPGALATIMNRWWLDHYMRLEAGTVPWDALYTGNVSVPRAPAIAVGGFNRSFKYCEDIEFGFRLHTAGLPFVYAPEATLHTRNPKTPAELARDLKRVGQAAMQIYRLAPETVRDFELGGFGDVGLRRRLVRGLVLRLDRLPGMTRLLDRVVEGWAGTQPRSDRRIYHAIPMVSFWRGVQQEATRAEWRRIAVHGVPVLMYHSVAPSPPDDRYTVHPRRFAQQMTLLRWMRRRVVSLEQLCSDWDAGRPAAGRAVALTFDDGYLNNATTAWPVLRRHGYPATMFLVTGCAGDHNAWDVARGSDRQPLVSWEQARALDAAGFRIHSHTVSHADLCTVDRQKRRTELRASLRDVESKLGHPARLFAYPYGNRGDDIIADVRGAGYRDAFSVRPGLNTMATPRWDRPRVEVRGTDGLVRFALKVWLGNDPAGHLPRWIRSLFPATRGSDG